MLQNSTCDLRNNFSTFISEMHNSKPNGTLTSNIIEQNLYIMHSVHHENWNLFYKHISIFYLFVYFIYLFIFFGNQNKKKSLLIWSGIVEISTVHVLLTVLF